MARVLEEGDELALPWDDLADGRAWDLVRGRDFFCSASEVEEAARNAAARLGKAVQTVGSRHASVSSVFVQFADYRVEAGEPCPCGSGDLRRVNEEYAVCASCGASVLVTGKSKEPTGDAPAADGSAGGDASATGRRLRIFVPEGRGMAVERKRLAALRSVLPSVIGSPAERKEARVREREERKAQIRERKDSTRQRQREARKRFREQQPRRNETDVRGGSRLRKLRRPAPTSPDAGVETVDSFTDVLLWTRRPGSYYGYGYDRKGRLALLEVTVQLTPAGVPVEDPAQPGRALHTVSAVRTGPFSAAVDADALLAKPGGSSPRDVLGLEPR